jgi:hypothetical protein
MRTVLTEKINAEGDIKTKEHPQSAQYSERKAFQPYLVLAGASLSGLVYAFIRFKIWFVNPPNFIDPWIYWGTSESDSYIGKYLGNTYYFRRWPLILPNQLFQSILSPLNAQFAFRSLLLFGISFLSAVLVYRATQRLAGGLITIILIVSNEHIVLGTGSTYTQGITLLVFVILLHLSMQRRSLEIPFYQALLVGLVSIVGFSAYPFFAWIVLPTIAASAVMILCGGERGVSPRSVGRLVKYGVFVGIGLVVGVALDLLIGRLWGYPWENVVSYSLRTNSALSENSPWATEISTFWKRIAFDRSSYALLALVFGATLLLFRSRRGRQLTFLGICATLLSGVYYLIPHLRGSTSPMSIIQTNIYLPLMVSIVVGCISAVFINQLLDCEKTALIQLKSWMLGVSGLAFFAIVVLRVRISVNERWFYLALLIIPTAAIFLRFKRRPMKMWLSRGIAFTLLSLSFIVCERVESSWAWAQRPGFSSWSQASEFLGNLSRTHRRITSLALRDDRRLWLLDNRPHVGWSTNISALYGNYSALTLGFPPPPATCSQVAWILGHPNSTVVVFGSRDLNSSMLLVRRVIGDCASVRLRHRMYDEQSETLWLDISLM